MRSRTEPATRKCCPSFCGTPPSAPEATVWRRLLEDHLLQAPRGLPVDGGRSEPREQNDALHFVGQFTTGEIIALYMAALVDEQDQGGLIARDSGVAVFHVQPVSGAHDGAFRVGEHR